MGQLFEDNVRGVRGHETKVRPGPRQSANLLEKVLRQFREPVSDHHVQHPFQIYAVN